MRGLVVGLTGYAGAGKDEAAKVLTRVGWVRVSFADPLRQALLNLDPIIDHKLDWNWHTHEVRLAEVVKSIGWEESKRSYPEIRRLLQKLGTEAGRDIHGHNCWTQIAERSMTQAMLTGKSCVLTDVRFPNELALVKQFGGILIRIERPGVGPVNSHVSDKQAFAAEDIYATLTNDGSPEKLQADLVTTITRWIGQFPPE